MIAMTFTIELDIGLSFLLQVQAIVSGLARAALRSRKRNHCRALCLPRDVSPRCWSCLGATAASRSGCRHDAW